MIPIHELLSRIRWDKEFGQGEFELGIYDRHEGTVQRVALKEITFPTEEPHVLQWMDKSGQIRRLPFHRIREVYRDGQRIWQRK